jgi:hypothetical protein
MNKDLFLFLYENEYGGPLKQPQRAGLLQLLGELETDNAIRDLRHVAYMLATVKHECAGQWQPIAEYGKGKGKKYGPRWYGRGYVQLTWQDNYRAMSAVTGVDLVADPDLAMVPKYAYRIMSFGMRNGSFTGVGLNRFINDKKCDYRGARKIINGTDCADRIAGYAGTIERMLRISVLPEELKLAA